MNFFKRFTNYIQIQPQNNQIQPQIHSEISLKSSNSFQIIMMDILDDTQPASHKKSQQIYQELVWEGAQQLEQEQHEGIQFMYMRDFIFLNKLEEPRELTVDQWNEMIDKKNMSIHPKKNIYFSILKGLKFEVRKKSWELLANTSEMKNLTTRTYKQLCCPTQIRVQYLQQIQKDVPRSKSVTSYQKQLRNLLIAYCTLTGNEYVQGMNLIAGSLLTILALENDEQLHQFEIIEKDFQQRVFWIFIGVMVYKKWQQIFDKNFKGLTQRLQILQSLIQAHLPNIWTKMQQNEVDMTIFSQYYITIMLYNTPKALSRIILDLFFIDGENALHSLIIRMMKIQEDKIDKMQDLSDLMPFFKKDMIVDCCNAILQDQPKAKKLEDFRINFMKSSLV